MARATGGRAGLALVAGLMLVAGISLAPAAAGAAGAAAPPRPALTPAPEPASKPAPEPASTFLPEPVAAGARLSGADALLAAAVKPGSGGWYWPIGAEAFSGWSGWLAPRGAYVHVAQDMPCAAGRPVYAVGDGVVFISRADAGGYGVGGSDGGCMIITHTTAAGTEFHALYGHVSGLRFKAGERVTAGEVIAKVNGCAHLHFSVHPGATYRDGNPYAGHVPKSWKDHGGFVDPVKFLKTNPRAAAYRPPALPRVEIVTSSAPLQYGAADGAAFWTEEGAAGAATYRLDLATQERRTLAPGEEAPAFDTRRFGADLLAAPAIGFAVSDHLTALSLAVKHATPAWGVAAQLTATLANSAGAPLPGAIVKLQRLTGTKWVNAHLGVTDDDGRSVLAFTPAERTSLRLRFAPPDAQPPQRTYLPAGSRTLVVTPHVGLTTPHLPASVEKDTSVTVAGYLTPHHPAGENSVDLVFQRRGAGGLWETELTVDALNRDAGARSRYVRSPRLLLAGVWRVQAAYAAGDVYAASASSWRQFIVE